MTGASPQWASIFALSYVASRTLYSVAYIGGVASVRSLLWTIGFVASIALMVLPIVT